jgi:hypothetical protein
MAIKVGVAGVTTKTVAVSGSTTQVKKVVVGTPVRRVNSASGSLQNLSDVDAVNPIDGSLLVYNSSRNKWVATKELGDGQNLNGGSF